MKFVLINNIIVDYVSHTINKIMLLHLIFGFVTQLTKIVDFLKIGTVVFILIGLIIIMLQKHLNYICTFYSLS